MAWRTETRGLPGLEGIEENLRFLVHEVRQQLIATQRLLERPAERPRGVSARDDYVDNLKTVIQQKCYRMVAAQSADVTGRATVDVLRSIEVVAVNLERVADFCENIAQQVEHLDDRTVLKGRNLKALFEQIFAGLDRVHPALFERATDTALQICRTEHTVDQLYTHEFTRLLEELKSGERVGDRVTVIFILRYVERMGDSLLNIGEAILSANLGQRIKIDQFEALEDSLESVDLLPGADDVALESVRETKSGGQINRVRRQRGTDSHRLVIFKDGHITKLEQERDAIEQWEAVEPGLAPRVLAFHRHGDHGSILFEYLEGRNLEEILLQSGPTLVAAVRAVTTKVRDLWLRSRQDTPIAPRFIEQLKRRVPAIYALHPEFRSPELTVGRLAIRSYDALLARAEEMYDGLEAPFSVLIHGDFNLDNIIYHADTGLVHFVDLHRSRMFDYVQDVSVLMVSCYRLQAFDEPVRRMIRGVITAIHLFATRFAEEHGDRTFQARLALGLARSLATSTRFVLDGEFAQAMFLRSRYLLERLVAHDPDRVGDFTLSTGVLLD